jgi:hypothetical protein
MRNKKSDKRTPGRLGHGAAWLAAAAMLAAFAAHPQPGFGSSRKAGASVIIKTETGKIKGELIGVREDAVVVMSEQGSDAIPVSGIETVTIVKPAPVVAFTLLGTLAGSAIGAATMPHTEIPPPVADGSVNSIAEAFADAIGYGIESSFKGAVHVAVCSSVGALIGWLGAKAVQKNKVIVFKGGSEADKAAALEILKKEARVTHYK